MIAFLNRYETGIKRTILSYVRENKDFLDDYIHEERTDSIVVLESYPTNGAYKGEYVDFICGGSGIGADGKYYGFYFSPNDEPMNIAYDQAARKKQNRI